MKGFFFLFPAIYKLLTELFNFLLKFVSNGRRERLLTPRFQAAGPKGTCVEHISLKS